MSKFAEKLQHIYRGPIATMGFRRSGEEEISQMLIVAMLADTSARAARAVTSADAVIVNSQDLSAEDLKQIASTLGDVPTGVLLDSTRPGEASRALEAGADFVVLDIKTPVEAVNKEGLGRILKIEPSLDAVLARAINSLPLSIDGVLIASNDSVLTIERLLVCQRFADLLDKPLLVTMGASVTGSELSSLCEAGVRGVVVPAGLTAKTLGELKKAVSCLPKPAKRKAKASPIIPRITPEPEAMVGEEEDDEE